MAGGDASRMGGIAKGEMKTEGDVSIIEHMINEFHLAGIGHIVILANDPQPYQKYGLEIVKDMRTGVGPIGGIETGLIHLSGRCNAVMYVPCDMPNFTASEIRGLKEAFVKSERLVVCAETPDNFWHPLCAVVHNELVKEISSAIDSGQRGVYKRWKKLGAEGVLFSEETPFLNINSFSDVRQWRKKRDEEKILCSCYNVRTA